MTIPNKLKNIRLFFKFTSLFMVMALIVAVTGGFGIWKIKTVALRVEEMLKRHSTQEKLAVLMKVNSHECQVPILGAIMVLDDMAEFESLRGEYRLKRDQFREYCDVLSKGHPKIGVETAKQGSNLEQRVDAVRQEWNGFESVAERLLSRKESLLKGIGTATNRESVRNALTGAKLGDSAKKEIEKSAVKLESELDGLVIVINDLKAETKHGMSGAGSDKVDAAIDDLLVTFSDLMTESKHEVSAIQQQAIIALVIVIISSILLAILLGALATQRIIIPVSELDHAADRIARGDLSTRVDTKSSGEMQALFDSFNQMAEGLEKTTVSKDYMDNIINTMIGALIVVSPDGRIVRSNAATYEHLGYEEWELVGQPAALIFNVKSPGICPEDEQLALEGSISNRETVFVAKDGLEVPMLFSASVIHDVDGGIQGIVYVALNITERKRAEEDIRRLNEELEQKVEEKTSQLLDAQEELVRKEKLSILGQLSGSVGHELRNPLGVMSNAIYFLKMVHADADDTTKEYLDIIKHEIDNSQRIIADLLDFARTKVPQTKTVTARQLIDVSLGKCVIPENVELQTELPDTLPPLRIDPHQMGQVFLNLITNAVQAMPEGGALSIAARLVGADLVPAHEQEGQPQELPLQANEDFLEISITDSGEGITPENMKRLFQPLFTTKAKGIGLGLVVCKNLAESNGGRIEVESKPGEGTTFMVMLPMGGE